MSALFDSPGLSAALEQLRQSFDFVVFDLPPANLYGDVFIISPRLDASSGARRRCHPCMLKHEKGSGHGRRARQRQAEGDRNAQEDRHLPRATVLGCGHGHVGNFVLSCPPDGG